MAGFARKWHLRPEDVADAEQEAVVSIAAAADRYEPDPQGKVTFGALLRIVAWRRCSRLAKAERRRKSHYDPGVDFDVLLNGGGDAGQRPVRRRNDNDPARDADKEELLQALAEAVRQLDQEELAVVDLKLDGLKRAQMAARLEISLRVMKRRYEKALKKLRQNMETWREDRAVG